MTEPEPSGWELMRAIRDLRTSVDKVAAGMVSQALFAATQQSQKDTDDRQNARIKQLEDDRESDRRTKAQQWFAIGLSGLGVVGTIIGGLILNAVKGGP